MNFESARDYCGKAGGEVFVPKSLAHLQTIERPSFPVWIGIMNPTGDNEYWINVNTGAQISFTHWAQNEPNNNAEKCVSMINADEGKWNDNNCDNTFNVMCMFDMDSASSKLSRL